MKANMLDRGELDERTHASVKPPTFASPSAERAHRKARLIGAYRIFANFGYDHWVAGHITVRDPEHEDRFWANPLGVSWHLIEESDLLLVDFDGNVARGRPPAERGRVRDPLGAAPGPARRQRRRARTHGVRARVVGDGPVDRADQPGRLRVLRRPRGVRRLHGRGVRGRRRRRGTRPCSGRARRCC